MLRECAAAARARGEVLVAVTAAGATTAVVERASRGRAAVGGTSAATAARADAASAAHQRRDNEGDCHSTRRASTGGRELVCAHLSPACRSAPAARSPAAASDEQGVDVRGTFPTSKQRRICRSGHRAAATLRASASAGLMPLVLFVVVAAFLLLPWRSIVTRMRVAAPARLLLLLRPEVVRRRGCRRGLAARRGGVWTAKATAMPVTARHSRSGSDTACDHTGRVSPTGRHRDVSPPASITSVCTSRC
jgi:hypothetical protein